MQVHKTKPRTDGNLENAKKGGRHTRPSLNTREMLNMIIPT